MLYMCVHLHWILFVIKMNLLFKMLCMGPVLLFFFV